MRLRGRVMFYATVMLMMAVAFTGHAAAAIPVDWAVGDVFVGIGNGKYQVWHNNGSAASPQYQLIQTISDTSVTGATAGCAFDSAYRLFGTDFTNSRTVRYAINNAYTVVQTISPSTSGFANSQSVAFDAGGNFYVGYGNGGLEKYRHDPPTTDDPRPQLLGSFSPPVELGGVNWIDVASDSKTVFYTSLGRKILTFDPTASPTSNVYADLSTFGSAKKGQLFAIRVLPPGNGTGGVLVADRDDVKLVKASNGVINSVQTFSFRGESNLQALSLDPLNPARFWVGDATTNDFILYDITMGKTVVKLNAGEGTKLGGICIDGGFSAAQNTEPRTTRIFEHVRPAFPSNTVEFQTPPFPKGTGAFFRATLVNLPSNYDGTLTVRSSLVDPSAAASDPKIFSFNPGNDRVEVPFFSGPLPCDRILPNLGGITDKCEVFQFEANPSLTDSVIANVEICPQDRGCDASIPLELDGTNPRLLRNLNEDITDGVDTFPLSGTRSNCVYTVNTQAFTPRAHSCGFQSPSNNQSFSKTQGSSIPFKFVAVGAGGTCPPSASGLLTDGQIKPLLMIAQLVQGAAPTPKNVIVKGNSGGPPLFKFSGNTWQLQVDTTNLAAGNYLATVIDLFNKIPSFSVRFSLN